MGRFLGGVITAVFVVGTIVVVKLISEAGKTLRQELRSYDDLEK